ncbi:Fatty acid desaturase [Maioricimonas rarisocia]|uniref:Fatty acid desaturase n=1 Tax=Maioricimonas rarisocia TaxID=2528026 RepID=A0A517Z0R0_9PLAN|nr:fatty acid desaturase family protein [Maioricimonas rarisocia]QDU36063.1 Fatty acid desaturase [Maioricimonas rarisocia]
MSTVAIQDRANRDADSILLHGARLTGAKRLAPVIRDASQLSYWKGFAAIAFDWAVIAGSFAMAMHSSNPLVWFVAALLIAGRQHALLVLMHEATHYRIVRNHAWNDRISNWFLAWPLFVTTEGFRADHLPHHFHLFTEQDPEWTRKRVRPEFQFPLSQKNFLVLVLKDALGFSIFKMFRLLANFSGAQQQETLKKQDAGKRRAQRIERLAYYAILFAAVGYFGLAVPVLLLWVLPAFTLLFAILRVRNVAEHSNVGVDHDLEMSRNVVAPTMLERLVLAPHNVGLHLTHHLYPSVPFYNLGRIHKELQSIPEYASDSLSVDTYFGLWGTSVLRDISRTRRNEITELLHTSADTLSETEMDRVEQVTEETPGGEGACEQTSCGLDETADSTVDSRIEQAQPA